MNTSVFSDEGIQASVTARPMRRRPVKRRPMRAQSSSHDVIVKSQPAVGTMARTKRLILAAVRVWELKKGIRD